MAHWWVPFSDKTLSLPTCQEARVKDTPWHLMSQASISPPPSAPECRMEQLHLPECDSMVLRWSCLFLASMGWRGRNSCLPLCFGAPWLHKDILDAPLTFLMLTKGPFFSRTFRSLPGFLSCIRVTSSPLGRWNTIQTIVTLCQSSDPSIEITTLRACALGKQMCRQVFIIIKQNCRGGTAWTMETQMDSLWPVREGTPVCSGQPCLANAQNGAPSDHHSGTLSLGQPASEIWNFPSK